MIDITTVSWFDLGWIVIAFSIAIWLIASALTGFDRQRLTGIERAARGGVGLVALAPIGWVPGVALLVGIAMIVRERIAHQKIKIIKDHQPGSIKEETP